jgi:hypothetical protein
MSHRAQKSYEIFAADWSPILLIPEHYRIIEIENDTRIAALEQIEIERTKRSRLKKKDKIMPPRLPDDMKAFGQTRAASADDGGFNSSLPITANTIAQAQPRAWSTAWFNDAENFHPNAAAKARARTF